MSPRFERKRGFVAELRESPGVVAFGETSARQVAASVRRVAPDETGYYKRRIRAQGSRVVALDPFWHLVEFGSANNHPYAPLRRGTLAAGLRLVTSPRPT